MSISKPSLADAFSVTADQLGEMDPPEIDALNAVVAIESYRIDDQRDRCWDRLQRALGERKVRRGRSMDWSLGRDEAEEKARLALQEGSGSELYRSELSKVLDAMDALGTEMVKLNQGPRKVLGSEWERRGGWSRFFLVEDGHIHRSQSCFTLRIMTRLAWQPHLSGRSDEEAVAELGPFLCSHCFRDAPTEWQKNPEDVKREAKKKDECDGSRMHVELDARMARRMSPSATCPVCGKEGVSVTSTWKLRAHKPKPADKPTEK
ncbi:hypothetical protein ACFYN0_26380 [Streptomyces sp. NPDC006704]|uniref:hypothetical protein n=1 Tax=Streptomyces sp. NPDC006704 TaxID=3364760 RepID=UPI0036D1F5BC